LPLPAFWCSERESVGSSEFYVQGPPGVGFLVFPGGSSAPPTPELGPSVGSPPLPDSELGRLGLAEAARGGCAAL